VSVGQGGLNGLLISRDSKLALAEYEVKTVPKESMTADNDLELSTAAGPSTTAQESIVDDLKPEHIPSAPPIADLASPTTHLPSTPSNILLGVQGLHRLFTEFQTSLVEKETRIAQLEMEVAVHAVEVQTEREMVKKVIGEKEEIRRELSAIKADDESASKVVERYM
jgi:hypothetical protein